ncbi:MAG: tRNA pseudouridine(55) synthase TruB [Phascolarctobacterium sp.]|nr:tRNA pseudouridine(55) synthase TruB [Phascolarctobacterium sp.]
MDGIFNVLKPPGMTSHDVIAFLRRALNTKKVGHGGTLDPDAAGVLPVFTGAATRLLEFAVEGKKQYLVEVTLGKQTDTGDDSGTVVKEMPVPAFNEAGLQKVLQGFLGKQKQLPPMYSAIKINGQKRYQLARKVVEVERELRDNEVYKLELLHFTESTLTLAVDCSKGTYIRVLGEDIANALGTCGTMSFLLRTQVGSYTLNVSHTLQEIAANPEACVAQPVTAVAHLPKLILTDNQAARITNGVRTTVAGTAEGKYVLMSLDNEFLGIGKCEEEKIQATKIFARKSL